MIATDLVALSYQLLDLSLVARPRAFFFILGGNLTLEEGAIGASFLVISPPVYPAYVRACPNLPILSLGTH
jgi:hypothetical protein